MYSRRYKMSSDPPPYESICGHQHQINDLNRQESSRNYYRASEERMLDFQKMIRRHEINKDFATKLRSLEGYEIVFICDDSSSMINPIGEITDPFASLPTRWDELKKIVSIVVDLASPLDPDGVDIYFLNRDPIFHVRSSTELANIFMVHPSGSTPIVPVLRRVLRDKHQQINERKLLILLATDGVPTDNHERPDINTLKQVLTRERIPVDRVPVTIIACTDDKYCMDYLNDWDKIIPNLDVVQDYRREKKQILACQGKGFPFSFGDYIVKILMGGVDSWFDDLDRTRVSAADIHRTGPVFVRPGLQRK
ncbi:hypothetical protein I4U23_015988 [Adineta vaga]|nr:hypothetical protein I4U23_015988 [Adineta vaga]